MLINLLNIYITKCWNRSPQLSICLRKVTRTGFPIYLVWFHFCCINRLSYDNMPTQETYQYTLSLYMYAYHERMLGVIMCKVFKVPSGHHSKFTDISNQQFPLQLLHVILLLAWKWNHKLVWRGDLFCTYFAKSSNPFNFKAPQFFLFVHSHLRQQARNSHKIRVAPTSSYPGITIFFSPLIGRPLL